MTETVFSKIINREIPADIIYEDDVVLSFLDINPANRGHALIIPKEPSINALDCDPEILAHIITIAQKIANVLMSSLSADGINLIMNNGEHAGQEVFHTHMHVIPRFKGDGTFQPVKHVNYKDGEASVLAMQIQAELES